MTASVPCQVWGCEQNASVSVDGILKFCVPCSEKRKELGLGLDEPKCITKGCEPAPFVASPHMS
ncbi:hypothetical protein LCGC14_1773190, partial [marine sediment metagenome]